MNATFADIHAAADYIGPGAIEVPLYQTEIFDICRRSSPFGQRIKQVPATGHPSRFFEETAIPNPGTAGFVNPRSITPPVVSPTRVEMSVPLKAVVAQINYNLFDIELGSQQQQFAYLQAKDLVDTVNGVMVTHDVALWNGNDTSLSAPTTTQYMGAVAQIAGGGNTLEFDRDRCRQPIDFDGRTAGSAVADLLTPQAIEGVEVAADVGEEYRDVEQVGPARAGTVQHGSDVRENGAALQLEVVAADIAGRVQRHSRHRPARRRARAEAGQEQQLAAAPGVRIGADRRRRVTAADSAVAGRHAGLAGR